MASGHCVRATCPHCNSLTRIAKLSVQMAAERKAAPGASRSRSLHSRRKPVERCAHLSARNALASHNLQPLQALSRCCNKCCISTRPPLAVTSARCPGKARNSQTDRQTGSKCCMSKLLLELTVSEAKLTHSVCSGTLACRTGQVIGKWQVASARLCVLLATCHLPAPVGCFKARG